MIRRLPAKREDERSAVNFVNSEVMIPMPI
jgi:hypothetical protein